jgi:hypothetical protein
MRSEGERGVGLNGSPLGLAVAKHHVTLLPNMHVSDC